MDFGVIAVHLGAGYHKRSKEGDYRKVCSLALRTGIKMMRESSSITAGEVAMRVCSVLENSDILNAGYGSNLTIEGTVECEASLMDASLCKNSTYYGAVSCVSRIKNPIEAAYKLAENQFKSSLLDLGRIPPIHLSSRGAEKWAENNNITMCDRKYHITEKAKKTLHKYKCLLEETNNSSSGVKRYSTENSNHHFKEKIPKLEEDSNKYNEVRLDTVGVVVTDNNGLCAAAASSGGILLKYEGRIGQVANFGTGCYAKNGKTNLAVVSSGCGEHLVLTDVVRKFADNAESDNNSFTSDVMKNVLKTNFIDSPMLKNIEDKNAGLLSIRNIENEFVEIVWGHTTKSMFVGHMATFHKRPFIECTRLDSFSPTNRQICVSAVSVKKKNITKKINSLEMAAKKKIQNPWSMKNDVIVEFLSDCDGITVDECEAEISNLYNRKILEEFEETINKSWDEIVEKNNRLFNGQKFRYSHVEEKLGKLIFKIGLTSYKEYMSTNLSESFENLQLKGIEQMSNKNAFVAHPLAVSGVVVTNDDKVVFQMRAGWVAESANLLDLPGGHPEPTLAAGVDNLREFVSFSQLNGQNCMKEIFDSMYNEVRDEVNVPITSLSDIKLMAVVRNKATGWRPVCVYKLKCNLSSNEILELYNKGGNETDESTKLVFIPTQKVLQMEQDVPETWQKLCPSGKSTVSIFTILHQKINESFQ